MYEELKARLKATEYDDLDTCKAAEAIEQLERQLEESRMNYLGAMTDCGQYERQISERDAEIAKLIEAVADHVTVRADQYAELQKYRDAPVVAYRHMMDDGWEYFDAPTGEDCSECIRLIVKPGE